MVKTKPWKLINNEMWQFVAYRTNEYDAHNHARSLLYKKRHMEDYGTKRIRWTIEYDVSTWKNNIYMRLEPIEW